MRRCQRSNLRAKESDVRQRENLDEDSATVAFIDIAGFSAIADVYGDAAALDVLEVFESMVRDALSGYEPPIKWIGDEAMLSFPEPETAIQVIGTLLPRHAVKSRGYRSLERG
jgi:adenylate cyclase